MCTFKLPPLGSGIFLWDAVPCPASQSPWVIDDEHKMTAGALKSLAISVLIQALLSLPHSMKLISLLK